MEESIFEQLDAKIDKASTSQGDFWVTLDVIRVEIDADYNRGALSEVEWRVLKGRANAMQDRLWIARQQPGSGMR